MAAADRRSRWEGSIAGGDQPLDTDAGGQQERAGSTVAGFLEESLPGERAEARGTKALACPRPGDDRLGGGRGRGRQSAPRLELVARLVVGHAEALASCGEPRKEFVAGFRAQYPRHVAFRRELDRLCASSPGL